MKEKKASTFRDEKFLTLPIQAHCIFALNLPDFPAQEVLTS
jgi:hypothetical protein